MKRTVILTISAAFISLSAALAGGQGNMTGEQIALKASDSNKSSQGIVVKGTMSLGGAGGGAAESRAVRSEERRVGKEC